MSMHVIAGLHVRHAGADLLDDASALVPEDRRQGRRVDPLHDVEVGVADAARRHAHEDLAVPRRVELHLLDHERLVELVEHRGPHARILPGAATVRRRGTDRAGAARRRRDRPSTDELVTLASDLIGFDTTAREPDDPPREERRSRSTSASGCGGPARRSRSSSPTAADFVGKPLYQPGMGFEGRPQLVARFAGTGGGKSLLFNGHIDAVSYEPIDALDEPSVQGRDSRREPLRPRLLRHEGRDRVHGLRLRDPRRARGIGSPATCSSRRTPTRSRPAPAGSRSSCTA